MLSYILYSAKHWKIKLWRIQTITKFAMFSPAKFCAIDYIIPYCHMYRRAIEEKNIPKLFKHCCKSYT